ncbi:MAG: protein translocase subunit SecF, partial [Actinobacteria bacterium]
KDKVVKAISAQYKVEDEQFEQVGPGWGAEITRRALWALVLSLVGLLIYISFRFEFKMAVAAIVALLHDIAVTIGIYSLVGRDVAPATIAALLTILGYSLYDTIVVFHKVGENTAKIGKESYGSMVNRSLNQVLMRSINTSITSLLPVFAILFFGGETLKDFAFALAIGMISGVYSSLMVASPLLVFWKEKEAYYGNLKRKYARS